MNKTTKVALWLTAIMFVFGFLAVTTFTYTGGFTKFEQDEIETKSYELDDFTKVDFETYGEIIIIEGDKNELVVKGTSNYIESLDVSVSGETLFINESNSPWTKIRVGIYNTPTVKHTLTVKDVDEFFLDGFGTAQFNDLSGEDVVLTLSGAGTISVEEIKATNVTLNLEGLGVLEIKSIDSDNLDIALEGAGSVVSGNIKVEDLTIDIAGLGSVDFYTVNAGNFTLTQNGSGSTNINEGSARSFKILLDGLSSVEARNFIAESARIELNGTGSVSVGVENSIDASVDGLGSVDYYGSPENVNVQSDGLGAVTRHSR